MISENVIFASHRQVLIKSHKDMFLDEIRQLRADRNTLQQVSKFGLFIVN